LVVPFSVKEKRYIMEWTLTIRDAAGEVVRSIGNKENRSAKITVPLFFKLLFAPKTGVAVPQSVTWDGTGDNGETVGDGEYTYALTAVDDNGNRSVSPTFTVVVDNTAPVVEVVQPAESDKFFGEGAKATLTIRQSGSAEDLWTGTISSVIDERATPVKLFFWRGGPPGDVTWDGKTGTEVFVNDGVYAYSIEAVDKAGNRSLPARVANIVYSAEKPQPSITISGSRYFSPNGDGVKDSAAFDVNVPAPGAGNTLVNAAISIIDNTGGRSVVYTGTAPARRFLFNGLDSAGKVLPEGSYWAEVIAEYRNGFKSAPARSPRFDLDITPPVVTRLAVNDPIFSPDNDGSKDRLRIDQDTAKNGAAAGDEWFAEITDSRGAVIRHFDLGTTPGALDWDGTTDAGLLAPDSTYAYRIFSDDLAGNHGEAKLAAAITLDTSKTELLVTAAPVAFSPNADRIQDSVTFRPVVKAGGGVASYTLAVKNGTAKNAAVVKTFTGTGAVPAAIVWDGRDDGGSVCPDGTYTADLVVRAANGSETATSTGAITLDTVFPAVTATAAYPIFSPDSDPGNSKKALPLSVTTSVETRWDAAIYPGTTGGTPVRTYTWRDKAVDLARWDGTDDAGNIVPDGTYRFEFTSTDAAGNKGTASISTVTVDARPVRAIAIARAEAFSSLSPRAALKAQRITVSATPKDGIARWTIAVVPAATTTNVGTAANSSAAVTPVKTWTGTGTMSDFVDWDGKLADATLAEGTYKATVHIEYHKGNIVDATTGTFIAVARAPALKVTTTPEFFSPDNDGVDDELTIALDAKSILPFEAWAFEIRDPENGKAFWTTAGTRSITPAILWDGRGNGNSSGVTVESAMDYPYTFSVTDTVGLTAIATGTIPVDILVILLPDGRLKIRVPSIYFKSNSPDFDDTRAATNERVLKRVAASLNRFKDYTVVIEGHSNKVSAGVTSDTNLALANALSSNRAKTVLQYLVKNGAVAASRLSAVGKGESEPLVTFDDHDNWWKNRRVEFILNK
jgi:outer membrane protein OmpA-like peptidoglycan-associated protein/flagellar hook assembly protein FlgD